MNKFRCVMSVGGEVRGRSPVFDAKGWHGGKQKAMYWAQSVTPARFQRNNWEPYPSGSVSKTHAMSRNCGNYVLILSEVFG